VGVWHGGKDRQVRLHDGRVPIEAVGAGLPQRRRADLEGDGTCGGILARDPVAVGRQPHDVQQRQRRFARHVLRRRLPQAARRRHPDGGIHVARILDRGRVKNPSQFVPNP
jgi:hypothetical protein